MFVLLLLSGALLWMCVYAWGHTCLLIRAPRCWSLIWIAGLCLLQDERSWVLIYSVSVTWLCISWFFSLLPRYRVPFLCPGHQHLVSHKTLCYWICLGTTGSNQLTKYLFPSYVLSLGGLGIQYQKNSFCWIWCILSSQCARSQTPEGCTTKQYRCWEFSVSCTCFSFCLLRSP